MPKLAQPTHDRPLLYLSSSRITSASCPSAPLDGARNSSAEYVLFRNRPAVLPDSPRRQACQSRSSRKCLSGSRFLRSASSWRERREPWCMIAMPIPCRPRPPARHVVFGNRRVGAYPGWPRLTSLAPRLTMTGTQGTHRCNRISPAEEHFEYALYQYQGVRCQLFRDVVLGCSREGTDAHVQACTRISKIGLSHGHLDLRRRYEARSHGARRQGDGDR